MTVPLTEMTALPGAGALPRGTPELPLGEPLDGVPADGFVEGDAEPDDGVVWICGANGSLVSKRLKDASCPSWADGATSPLVTPSAETGAAAAAV